ncbi:hypothetical protein CEXT_679641 [Caerostris extrusa]|uniref:DUF7041 domain-containing protein n=1 Tax=Caerostris extrusa TaxID=172846 RepID=A0AAV4XU87_CAEEX|nr:hypothetical protein CEXT_679641 [Caerostris extrusa]
MESQFTLAGVTTETTKFHHVVSALQPEELADVSDIILQPPAEVPFTALKKRLYCPPTFNRFWPFQTTIWISWQKWRMASWQLVVRQWLASADQPGLRTMLCEITSRLQARTRDRLRGRNQRRSASRSRQTENLEHCWYNRKFK